MFLRKLESRGTSGIRPVLDDNVNIAYTAFEYEPVYGTPDCKGRKHVHKKLNCYGI